MSSKLQLDVRHLNRWWRHLVNAYEVRQAWCLLQVKPCDPCLRALKWFVYHARRYTSARLYFFYFTSSNFLSDSSPSMMVSSSSFSSWTMRSSSFTFRFSSTLRPLQCLTHLMLSALWSWIHRIICHHCLHKYLQRSTSLRSKYTRNATALFTAA